MIIHNSKAVFIHIPKTGGVSLCLAIAANLTKESIPARVSGFPKKIKKKLSLTNAQKHKQARQLLSDRDITKQEWKDYFKFSFVRNPWSRTVSEFCWRHEMPTTKAPKDFKKFIEYCSTRINDKTNKKKDTYWEHAQTQKSYITDLNGRVIIDKIFYLENIINSITELRQKLNIPLKFEKHNSSKHDHYTTFYDNESREMIKELYKEDIELFGYTFRDKNLTFRENAS